MRLFLFSAGFIASFAPSLAHADICRSIFNRGPAPQAQLEDAKTAYLAAHAVGDTYAAAIAVLDLAMADLRLTSRSLTRGARKGLKVYREVLMNRHVVQTWRMDNQPNSYVNGEQLRSRLLSTFGIREFAESMDGEGRPRNLAQRSWRFLKERTKDGLWMLGPFMFRGVLTALSLSRVWRSYHYLSQNSRMVASQHGLPLDGFFERMLREHFNYKLMSNRAGAFYEHNVLRPFFASFGLLVSGLHPAFALQPVQPYEAFAQDIQAFTDILDSPGRVEILLGEDLAHAVETYPDSSKMTQRSINYWVPGAEEATVRIVKTVDDLRHELNTAGNADTVMIFDHGFPGDLHINGTSILPKLEELRNGPKLKSGANLIYVACRFGDTRSGDLSGKNEAWVQLADARLSNGKAVAATAVLNFGSFMAERQASAKVVNDPAIEAIGIIASGLYLTALQSMQAALTQPAAEDLYDHFVSHLGSVPGIRVYDSQTGQVEFFHR